MSDPLKPAGNTDQNPETPQRLPGSTAGVASTSSGNEAELGGRPAFLFRSDEMLGVTLDSSGTNLPRRTRPWVLERYFTLGVSEVGLAGINPEVIIRGIRADGYYVWQTSDPSRAEGTSQ